MVASIRILIAAGVLAVALFATGSASATTLSCGDVIVANSVLTTNLHCTGTGLTIGADGVTLDLNGHKLVGAGGGDGVDVNADNDTVKNGLIKGFGGDGIRTGSFLSGPTIDNMEIRENAGNGVHFDLAPGIVANSKIARNGIDGVADTGGSTIQNNKIVRNGHYGVEAAPGVGGATTITNNKIIRNGLGGIQTGIHYSIIVGNKINKNGGNGINVSDVLADSGGVITDNIANGNTGLGISVCVTDPPGDTCGLGNETDGGGNSAKNNSDPRQCLNIVCSRRP